MAGGAHWHPTITCGNSEKAMGADYRMICSRTCPPARRASANRARQSQALSLAEIMRHDGLEPATLFLKGRWDAVRQDLPRSAAFKKQGFLIQLRPPCLRDSGRFAVKLAVKIERADRRYSTG